MRSFFKYSREFLIKYYIRDTPLGKLVRIFNSLLDVKNHIEKFLADKPQRFRKNGIFQSRERPKNPLNLFDGCKNTRRFRLLDRR